MPTEDWVRLTFEKGLNTFDRASVLADGEVQAMENFEPLPSGGVTPRPAWKPAGSSPTGEPTLKRGRGLYTGYYQAGVRRLIVSGFSGGNYVTLRTNVSDPTAF